MSRCNVLGPGLAHDVDENTVRWIQELDHDERGTVAFLVLEWIEETRESQIRVVRYVADVLVIQRILL